MNFIELRVFVVYNFGSGYNINPEGQHGAEIVWDFYSTTHLNLF
jgi:hypothetical protein